MTGELDPPIVVVYTPDGTVELSFTFTRRRILGQWLKYAGPFTILDVHPQQTADEGFAWRNRRTHEDLRE